MRVVIAGGHGQIALLLGQQLAGRGDQAVGVIRDPAQAATLERLGIEPLVADLEHIHVDRLAEVVRGADAVVFAAGAGPGSGAPRKDTVDRAAALLLADAAEACGVSRYLLVSSMGVDTVRDGATPDGVDPVFVAYLRAKLAAEDELLEREGLDLTVLRPGRLTNEPASGRVRLAPRVRRSEVTRADVARVIVALLDAPTSNEHVLELVGGDTPIDAAVAAVTS